MKIRAIITAAAMIAASGAMAGENTPAELTDAILAELQERSQKARMYDTIVQIHEGRAIDRLSAPAESEER